MKKNKSSGCKLGRARKRHRENKKDSTSATDRLTQLPNLVIYHILSFLDTKSVVRTSVLSRAWRCAWKHVPVLDLCSNSFHDYRSFQRFVDGILSLRYPCSVRKVRYIDHGDSDEQDDSLFARVVEYASCHDAQHLVIELENDLEFDESYRFSDLFGLVLSCNVRTLELECVAIDSGFGSFGFQMLTTLKLEWCLLSFDEEEDIDPFSNFPCLQNLTMEDCSNVLPRGMLARSFKVSGLQLLTLNLQRMNFDKIEIVAPKLKYFCLVEDMDHSSEFSELNIPSLDHAELLVYPDYGDERENEWVEQHLISLFQGVHNAETLALSGIVEALSDFDEILENQPSPFTRLKHLNLHSNNVPYRVVDYLLKGSSCAEPVVEFV